MSDPHVDTQADGSGWGLESVAWTPDGQEVSRCEMETGGGRHQWLLSNADTRLAGEFTVEPDSEGRSQFVGTINGQAYWLPIGEDGWTAGATRRPDLDAAHADLVAQWAPLYHDLVGLLELVAPGDGGEVAGAGKCAVAGAMTAVGCLATASTLLFGHFVCDDIAESALDWCRG